MIQPLTGSASFDILAKVVEVRPYSGVRERTVAPCLMGIGPRQLVRRIATAASTCLHRDLLSRHEHVARQHRHRHRTGAARNRSDKSGPLARGLEVNIAPDAG
jgi:hypothetical protein